MFIVEDRVKGSAELDWINYLVMMRKYCVS